MNQPLLILYLEDSPRDAELVRDNLRQASVACELRIACDRAEYEAALVQARFDLILSDYRLPHYDGMAALALAREKQPEVPFILISGTLGEERAVDCMLHGATDYVLKHRLVRLVPAIRRALTETEEHRKRQEAEAALRRERNSLEERVQERTASLQASQRILKDTLSLLDATLDSTADGILVVDGQGRILKLNQKFVDLWHIPQSIIDSHDDGQALAFVLDQVKDPQGFLAKVKELYSQPAVKSSDVLEFKDGRICERYSRPLRNSDTLVGRVWSFRDVTKRAQAEKALQAERALLEERVQERTAELQNEITVRKQTEAALRANEESFREAQRLAHVGSWKWAMATDTVTWSEELCRIAGRNPGLPPSCFAEMSGCYTPESWTRLNAAVPRALQTGQPDELALDMVRPDGTIRHTAVHAEFDRDASGRIVGLHGTVQDNTERQAAEDRLRLLTTALESAANGVVITKADGTILWVNAAFTTLTGYAAAEAVGQNPRILKSGKHDLAFYRAMQAGIAGGQVWHGEITNRRKDGSLYQEEMTITPVRQGAGPITHFIAIKQDVTERKKAEANRSLMEVQLRQAQKLESIGQLAAGIAHEINTPTQYIGDNTRFLQDSFVGITRALGQYDRLLQAVRQEQVTPQLVEATTAAAEAADIAYLAEEVPKSISQTLQGVAHVAKIVRAMKDFSHPGSEAKTPTDLNHAIESTVTVAHNEWKYVADLDLVLDPQLPLVPCLPGEINQVILNLVVNAAHAIGDVVGDGAGGKGRICVSTSRQGDWAEIRVQDTGTGIPEAARARVFDPFFTTKAVGKGTGQGLAIAHSVVVEQHGGTITFETELGKGTTFIVRLPLHPGLSAQERNS